MRQLLLLVAVCVAGVCARPSSYTDKFDHINVDEVLESQRLLKSYVECLMDRGRCTPDAKALKETLPDALETECSKCTPKQKESSDKVVKFLVNKRPELWDELASKYDPDRIYQERYKEKVNALKE